MEENAGGYDQLDVAMVRHDFAGDILVEKAIGVGNQPPAPVRDVRRCLHAKYGKTGRCVLLEPRSVIAPNVDDQVARLEIEGLRKPGSRLTEVLGRVRVMPETYG